MPTARVVCSVSLRVELYSELDGPDGRLAKEALSLVASVANAANPQADPKPLNPDAAPLNEEGPPGTTRPFYVIPNARPISWSFVFNTFRKADEAEFTFPLALLPVPPEAIRVISCFAAVRHLSAEEWAVVDGQPELLDDSLSNADFAGICSGESISIQPGEIPTVKLPFRDFVGLLAAHKVPPGTELDRSLPISQAIAKLLVGSPAEKIPVTWADPTEKEPTVEQHIAKAQKKPKGKKQKKPVKSQQSYLDVITEECARIGCVARLDVTTLEISNAGPLYEGQLSKSSATLLVSQVIESIEAEHTLVGLKTQGIQLVGYNPDTGAMLTARWPPDAKSAKATVVEPGKPPRLPPLAANIGLPGYEQLDESVLLIPVGGVSSQDRLLKMAQMVFLERTRQRIRYTLKTHAPWSNPYAAEVDDGGQLLRLRAGDTVTFGYLAAPDEAEDGTGALLPPVVRALTGTLSAEGNAALLERIGVPQAVAAKIGAMLVASPRFNEFRVDELHVSGGAKQDAELTLKLVNFTQIVDDVQRKAEGRDPAATVARIIEDEDVLATRPLAEVKERFAQAQKEINEADEAGNIGAAEKAQAQLDASYQRVMKGR